MIGLALIIASGCSASTTSAPAPPSADGATTEPGAATLPPGDPAAFGTYCELGGSPGRLFSSANPKCTLGFCVFDGVRDLVAADGNPYHEAYCSADCSTVSCPDGWECVATENTGPMICAKQVSVCGDSVKQLDEACDDGNLYTLDGCSRDCKKVRGPSLNIESLVIGSGSTSAYYEKVPAKGTNGEWAVFDEISADAFKITFAAPSEAGLEYQKFVFRLPRKVGVVSLGSTFTAQALAGGMLPLENRAPPKVQVVSAGTDGRSYRVSFSFSNAYDQRGVFVATLP